MTQYPSHSININMSLTQNQEEELNNLVQNTLTLFAEKNQVSVVWKTELNKQQQNTPRIQRQLQTPMNVKDLTIPTPNSYATVSTTFDDIEPFVSQEKINVQDSNKQEQILPRIQKQLQTPMKDGTYVEDLTIPTPNPYATVSTTFDDIEPFVSQEKINVQDEKKLLWLGLQTGPLRTQLVVKILELRNEFPSISLDLLITKVFQATKTMAIFQCFRCHDDKHYHITKADGYCGYRAVVQVTNVCSRSCKDIVDEYRKQDEKLIIVGKSSKKQSIATACTQLKNWRNILKIKELAKQNEDKNDEESAESSDESEVEVEEFEPVVEESEGKIYTTIEQITILIKYMKKKVKLPKHLYCDVNHLLDFAKACNKNLAIFQYVPNCNDSPRGNSWLCLNGHSFTEQCLFSFDAIKKTFCDDVKVIAYRDYHYYPIVPDNNAHDYANILEKLTKDILNIFIRKTLHKLLLNSWDKKKPYVIDTITLSSNKKKSYETTLGLFHCLGLDAIYERETEKSHGFITDAVIDNYLLLLKDHFVSSKGRTIDIMSTDFSKHLTDKKGKQNELKIKANNTAISSLGQNINNKIIYIPYNIDNIHWVLIVADLNQNKLFYYDSLKTQDDYLWEGHCNNIQNSLTEIYSIKSVWSKSELILSNPQQINGYDCGIYVLMYIELLTHDIDLNFEPSDATRFRLKVAHSLMQGRYYSV